MRQHGPCVEPTPPGPPRFPYKEHLRRDLAIAVDGNCKITAEMWPDGRPRGREAEPAPPRDVLYRIYRSVADLAGGGAGRLAGGLSRLLGLTGRSLGLARGGLRLARGRRGLLLELLRRGLPLDPVDDLLAALGQLVDELDGPGAEVRRVGDRRTRQVLGVDPVLELGHVLTDLVLQARGVLLGLVLILGDR